MNATIDKRKLMIPAAVVAVLVMVLASVAVIADGSDATGEDLTSSHPEYGTVNEITLAPGYQWPYDVKFPEGLEDTVLSFEQNEMGSIATIDGHRLSIAKIPASMAGNRYNIVLKAFHEESDQTSFQWIRVTVNQAMAVSSTGVVSSIIAGQSQDITLSSTGGIGTVTWDTVSMPAGLSLSGSKVTGTPATVGKNTVVVKAISSESQTMDLAIEFTVYSKIVGGSAETITAVPGKAVSSTAITNESDIGVTWSVTNGTLPAGFSIDKNTGVVSGTYSGSTSGTANLTLTGVASNGPAQQATKSLTIYYEQGISISGGSQIVTYTGNAQAKTTTLSVPGYTGDITWSIPATTGISIGASTGVLSISGTAAVTSDGSIIVTASTANGQTATKEVKYVVEDTLKITGPSELKTFQSRAASIDIAVSGGSGNSVVIEDSTYGDALTFANGKLSIFTSAKHDRETVTLKATSAGGQTATMTVDVTVFAKLGFDSAPTVSGIAVYVEG